MNINKVINVVISFCVCALRIAKFGVRIKKKKKAIFLTRIYPVFREGKRNIYFPDIGAGSQASDCNSTKSKQTVNRERGGREKKEEKQERTKNIILMMTE